MFRASLIALFASPLVVVADPAARCSAVDAQCTADNVLLAMKTSVRKTGPSVSGPSVGGPSDASAALNLLERSSSKEQWLWGWGFDWWSDKAGKDEKDEDDDDVDDEENDDDYYFGGDEGNYTEDGDDNDGGDGDDHNDGDDDNDGDDEENDDDYYNYNGGDGGDDDNDGQGDDHNVSDGDDHNDGDDEENDDDYYNYHGRDGGDDDPDGDDDGENDGHAGSGEDGSGEAGSGGADRGVWLEAVNGLRAAHGACPLAWAEPLADGIKEWVDNLTTLAHSDSYDIPPPGGPCGENLAWASNGMTAKQAIDMWYNEVYNCAEPLPGCRESEPGTMTGHFTAMVWKGSMTMGCAISADGNYAGCRWKAGDTLSAETPNMANHYMLNVGAEGETPHGC